MRIAASTLLFQARVSNLASRQADTRPTSNSSSTCPNHDFLDHPTGLLRQGCLYGRQVGGRAKRPYSTRWQSRLVQATGPTPVSRCSRGQLYPMIRRQLLCKRHQDETRLHRAKLAALGLEDAHLNLSAQVPTFPNTLIEGFMALVPGQPVC